MKYSYFLLLIIGLVSCHSRKQAIDKTSTQNAELLENDTDLEFGCYYASDTIDNLVLYFPEEKKFYINGDPGSQEELCELIQTDIAQNKGVKHYYDPQSNFMYMISIVRAVKKCYLDRIDELSISEYGNKYEGLSPEQKANIDSSLSYRVIGE